VSGKRRPLRAAGFAGALVALLAGTVAPARAQHTLVGGVLSAAPVVAAAPSAARQRELLALLRDDCGACHGMRRTGGLGPALTPAALRDRPDDGLVATVLSGRSGTAMPPWRPFLSEADAVWLVAHLKSGGGDQHAAQ